MLGRASDERLVEQLRRGNEVAFEVLFDRHHAALLSFCRHLLGSLEAAEDAVQQTFLSAHRQLSGRDRPIHHVKSWLFTIARNRCVSMLRSRHEEPSADLPERVSVAGLSEQVEEREDVRELLGDLAELPIDQRSALLLAEGRALSHEEVSYALGCDVGKVKSLVFQARSSLIERRDERETPCTEFQEQIALGGPALRRGPLRRHMRSCPGCGRFGEQVRTQRAMIALALPVLPSVGFREGVLTASATAAGGGAGGGAALGAGAGAAAGSSAGGVFGGGGLLGGGAASAFGVLVGNAAGTAKVALAAAAATGAALGGGVVIKDTYKRVTGGDEAARGSDGLPGSGRDSGGEDQQSESGEAASGPGTAAAPKERTRTPGQRRGSARDRDGDGQSQGREAASDPGGGSEGRGSDPDGRSGGSNGRDDGGERANPGDGGGSGEPEVTTPDVPQVDDGPAAPDSIDEPDVPDVDRKPKVDKPKLP